MTYTQVAVDDNRHKPIPMLDCLYKHTFLFRAYRSGSLTCMQRYALAYLFHLYGTNLLSRDCRIADCTVRHPGIERLLLNCLSVVTIIYHNNYLTEVGLEMYSSCTSVTLIYALYIKRVQEIRRATPRKRVGCTIFRFVYFLEQWNSRLVTLLPFYFTMYL